jgi:DNA-3-methyladenine glycosylase I
MADLVRCSWPRAPLDIEYHDTEWGVPVHEDRLLFEMLTLEGAQAGLSWSTILAKRANYRLAFDGFDVARIARYTEARQAKLLDNPGIVRNRLKVQSTVNNARAFLAVQSAFGSFDAYLWRFVEGIPLQNKRRSVKDVPASTALSDTISKDLSQRGFKFIGSTIVYAYMQAIGLVNDHLINCFRHTELAQDAVRAPSTPYEGSPRSG